MRVVRDFSRQNADEGGRTSIYGGMRVVELMTAFATGRRFYIATGRRGHELGK